MSAIHQQEFFLCNQIHFVFKFRMLSEYYIRKKIKLLSQAIFMCGLKGNLIDYGKMYLEQLFIVKSF